MYTYFYHIIWASLFEFKKLAKQTSRILELVKKRVHGAISAIKPWAWYWQLSPIQQQKRKIPSRYLLQG